MDFSAAPVAANGITVLWEPEGHFVDADILFVHGLQGHPEKTWLHESDEPTLHPRFLGFKTLFRSRKESTSQRNTVHRKKRRVFWPRDLLPALCPTCRIMTFGYDTMVTKAYAAADKGNIFSHAKDLLYELDRARVQGRYTIFVAHSLGGIIVKEVLRRSELSGEPSLRDIIDHTLAVVFMGTPHRGSPGFTSPADVVRRVAQTILRMDTNPAILRSLGLDSPELELCRESFMKQWREKDFAVKTFQESTGVSGINAGPLNGKVVPDTSSSLDDPREHAETLPGDHRNMCRFSSTEDPAWKKVGPEIQRLSKIRRAFEHACGECLRFPELPRRQEAIRPPMQNTCDWFFQSQEFGGWVNRTNHQTRGGFLWLKGKPGSGKSTLVKEAVTRISQLQKSLPRGEAAVIAPFFFNARGSYLEQSPLGMMRALCYHLLQGDGHFATHISNHYRQKSEENRGIWEPLEDELYELVTSGFESRRLARQRIIFFIDALDECEENKVRTIVRYLASLLETVTNAGQRLDILLSSRHYPTITAPKSVDIVVEDGNKADILQYIKRSIPYNIMPNAVSAGVLHNLLLRKSSGIFLWVVLVIDIVIRDIDEGKSGSEIETTLAEVPDDLVTLFYGVMKTIKKTEQVKSKQLISLVLLAQRQLPASCITILQLFTDRVGESVGDDAEILGSLKRTSGLIWTWDQDQERIKRTVRTMSRGLIEVNRAGSLQFIHETVREFFTTEGPRIFNMPLYIAAGHCSIIRACILAVGLLQVPEENADGTTPLFNPYEHLLWFQEYVKFLPHHAVEARKATDLPNQLIHSIDRIVALTECRGFQMTARHPHAKEIAKKIKKNKLEGPILYDKHLLSCCVNTSKLCNDILHRLEQREPDRDPNANRLSSLLGVSINSWHWQTQSLSRVFSRNREQKPAVSQLRTSSGPSFIYGHHERELLVNLRRQLTNITAFEHFHDHEGNTLLHIAAWQGMCEVIKVLLDHNHPVNIHNSYGLSPLHLAVQYQQHSAASLLLAGGADPSTPGPGLCTPLHFVVEMGRNPDLLPLTNLLLHYESERILDQSTGAAFSRDALGRTPLHTAAKYNAADEIITALLQADADPSALDHDLVSPIMIASYYGRAATHWGDPRIRWEGHKTNFEKMQASRMGHQSWSGSRACPESFASGIGEDGSLRTADELTLYRTSDNIDNPSADGKSWLAPTLPGSPWAVPPMPSHDFPLTTGGDEVVTPPMNPPINSVDGGADATTSRTNPPLGPSILPAGTLHAPTAPVPSGPAPGADLSMGYWSATPD